MTCMISRLHILFLFLLLWSTANGKLYTWTDVNGQKIEADFVRADQNSITISMEGQELVLPLDSLSAFSKALAIKLRSQSVVNDTKKTDLRLAGYPRKNHSG